MCIKLSRRLNPMAQEWRPIPQQRFWSLPHQLFRAASQPLAVPPPPHPAVFAAAEHPFYCPYPPPEYRYYSGFDASTVYSEGYPVYFIATLADPYAGAAAEAAKPFSGGGDDPSLEAKENVAVFEEKTLEKLKSPSSPRVHSVGNGSRRVFPPRLLKAKRVSPVVNTPPPPLSPQQQQRKLEWRPRKAPRRPDRKVPGDGRRASRFPQSGLARPPPPSERDSSYSSKTTVMIRNIPNQLRRDLMLQFLDHYCREHSLEYDFFYLPMDFGRRDNLGYAFVNFTSSISAMKMKEVLQGFRWGILETGRGSIASKKVCETTWARIQGKEALIKRFEKTSFNCDRLDYLPVVLDPARNGSDPNPPPPVVLGSLHPPP